MNGSSTNKTLIKSKRSTSAVHLPVHQKGEHPNANSQPRTHGYDGEPLNKLWDTHTNVFASSAFLANGGGLNYRVRYLSQGDCIVWVVHILGVR